MIRSEPSLRRRPLLPTVLLLTASLLGTAAPAAAQSGDLRELINRVNRLETELQTLSRDVYRGGGRPSAPASGGMETAPPSVAASLEARLTRMENDMLTLNGRYEEAAFQIGQLRDQLSKLSADIDFRLSRLEQGAGGGLPPAGPAPLAGPAAEPSPAPSSPASSSPVRSEAPSASEPATGNLPTGSAQEQYDYAFNLTRQGDYAGAERAFTQFLAQHPTHQLAPNAQYWLGETLYVRNKYKESARAFAEGYKKYPKSNKAPDSLLKLAMALGNLNQREDACIALDQLRTDFKDAPGTIQRRAEQERNRLRCG
ncbi:tol-pal system protein YbgF [Rhodocista pekingensis]|uniref:Cell division coordinator CpoB n=1 Tax=Rhodocista pekingensis TaxID=201185 RepID=A0ABW2KVU7_9PROT